VDPQTASWGEDAVCPIKKYVCSPPVGIKTPYPTVNRTKKPCLIFGIILPPLMEHIDEKVGLEKGIAATP